MCVSLFLIVFHAFESFTIHIYVHIFELSSFPHYLSFPSVVIIFHNEFNISYIIFMFLAILSSVVIFT